MQQLPTRVDTSSVDFRANAEHNRALADELTARIERVKPGGDDKARERQKSQGKLFARERIAQLLDPGSPWLELSALAGWDLYDDFLPAGGIVTGIGAVHGRPCIVVANDATVKGGTYHPITVKKH